MRNRLPKSDLKEGETPYERWYGRKPDVSHFRERRKLDTKSKKMRFVGYSLTSKGYRLFDETNRKRYIRRDVEFNESYFGQKSAMTTESDQKSMEVKQNEKSLQKTKKNEQKLGDQKRTKNDKSHKKRKNSEDLKGTVYLGLSYKKCADGNLIGYSDADWAGDVDDRHSTSGNVFLLAKGAVSWLSKKQATVALSTTEAEYVALSAATQEAIWLRRLLTDVGESLEDLIVINEDNQKAIAMAENPVGHARTKHIDIRYHFVREGVQDGAIILKYVATGEMTKPLPKHPIEKLVMELGMKTVK